jgi:diadenosine tetraphosphate (Ap4A) HIT family hydrolase
VNVEGCLACDLASGRRALPGGVIHQRDGWVIEHCVGPLGVGTLIAKPRRHVTRVTDLDTEEAAALGPMLVRAAQVVTALTEPQQVYVTLWSHADGVPGHIHFVIQPVTSETRAAHDGKYGLPLQTAVFEEGVAPDVSEVEAFAARAGRLFAELAVLGQDDSLL